MARFADSRYVDESCEQCDPPKNRRFHRRVGRLNLCRRCVERIAARHNIVIPLESAEAERWSLRLASAGLLVRTLFYALLFGWASRSDVGAAALQGVVAADVLTFLVLGAYRISFDGLAITVDGAFEIALIVFYVNRGSLFSIHEDATFVGISFPFFLGFTAVRLGIWGAEQATESVSGA